MKVLELFHKIDLSRCQVYKYVLFLNLYNLYGIFDWCLDVDFQIYY